MSGTGIYVNGLAEPLDMSGPPPANVKRLDELQDPAPPVAVGSTLKAEPESDPVSISILRDDLEAARLRVSELEDENLSWRELLLESGLQLLDASRAEGSRARAQSEAGVMCLKAAWGIT